MSSSTLTTAQNQLNLYGYSICMVLGNIDNILTVIVFSRQRQNTCSIYLISLAVMNDLYLTFNSLFQVVPFYYRDETVRAFVLCKLHLYLPTAFGQIAKTILVLACIDRFLITNDRAIFRAFIVCSHVAVMTTIINGQCGLFGIYSTFFSFYTIIFVGLIPPITLGIFGYLTYRNMRERQLRVQPIVHNTVDANNSIRRRDRELLTIVISEVLVYVVTSIPSPLILLEMIVSKYIISSKSVRYSQIENFIVTVAFLLLFVNSAAPFYIYLISSKPFRRDVKQLIINGYGKLRRQPPILTISTTHHALTQHDTYV